MKHVPFTIDTEKLLEELSLDLRSIRYIFDFRIKASKGEKKLIKTANNLIVGECFKQFHKKEMLATGGYILEGDPEKRRRYMPKGLIEKDVCDSCDHDIVTPTFQSTASLCVFIGCKHTFHKHCLNIYYKETDADKDINHLRCPKCAEDKTDLTLE